MDGHGWFNAETSRYPVTLNVLTPPLWLLSECCYQVLTYSHYIYIVIHSHSRQLHKMTFLLISLIGNSVISPVTFRLTRNVLNYITHNNICDYCMYNVGLISQASDSSDTDSPELRRGSKTYGGSVTLEHEMWRLYTRQGHEDSEGSILTYNGTRSTEYHRSII